MDLQNEAIELQKVFHQDYKTYWEETEAIKAHLEARFKALGLYDVVGQSEQLVICKKCGSSEMYQYTKTKDKCEDCGNIQDYFLLSVVTKQKTTIFATHILICFDPLKFSCFFRGFF